MLIKISINVTVNYKLSKNIQAAAQGVVYLPSCDEDMGNNSTSVMWSSLQNVN